MQNNVLNPSMTVTYKIKRHRCTSNVKVYTTYKCGKYSLIKQLTKANKCALFISSRIYIIQLIKKKLMKKYFFQYNCIMYCSLRHLLTDILM